jgi:hypothetical protein
MRVRPKRSIVTRRLDRSVHPVSRTAPEPEEPVAEHPMQRRAKESGGPLDHAQYRCSCGYIFHAAVSTSVACPHCGTGQAW